MNKRTDAQKLSDTLDHIQWVINDIAEHKGLEKERTSKNIIAWWDSRLRTAMIQASQP